MTDQEYRTAIEGVIHLAGCAVKGIVPDQETIAALDLEQVYRAAEDHKLAAAVGMALESAGCCDRQFSVAVAKAQRRTALLDADRAAVLAKLEEAGIWYMPLKGAILKDLYPRFGMREMVDNDILFDDSRAEDVRQIMEGLGFATKRFESWSDDEYQKPPVSNFEMHRALFHASNREDLYPYFADAKERLIKDEGNSFGYHFSNEDFYIYGVAHEYKHYSRGGTGLRSLVDTYVFLKKTPIDMEYVRRVMEKIGISDFEQKNRELALKLFDGGALEPNQTEMLEYIISSGTFGTAQHEADNLIAEKGRVDFLLSRMTLPRKLMQDEYPILKKLPILYPFVWVWRFIFRFFTHHNTFMVQLKAALGLKRGKDK